MARAAFRGDGFKQGVSQREGVRHTLKEEDAALARWSNRIEKGRSNEKTNESLRNLVDLSDAGMLDCWILINGADQGCQDYEAYRRITASYCAISARITW